MGFRKHLLVLLCSVLLMPAFVGAEQALMLKGFVVDAENPYRLRFIFEGAQEGEKQRAEALRQIRYFLATLTLPQESLWVNLSPDPADKIMPEDLELTDLGIDLLAEDLELKKTTASLLLPDQETGTLFWDNLLKQNEEDVEKGSASIGRIWIVPDQAEVFQYNDLVLLGDATLDVKHESAADLRTSPVSTALSPNIKKFLLPKIRKEINSAATFQNLRCMYAAMVLATYYKSYFQDLQKDYANQRKLRGLEPAVPEDIERLYDLYLQHYELGGEHVVEEWDDKAEVFVERGYTRGGFLGNRLNDIVMQKEVSLIEKLPKVKNIGITNIKLRPLREKGRKRYTGLVPVLLDWTVVDDVESIRVLLTE